MKKKKKTERKNSMLNLNVFSNFPPSDFRMGNFK